MKLLKGINYLAITVAIVLIIIFFVNLFGNPLYSNDGRFFTRIPYLISIPLLVIFSTIISVKTHQQKGVMLFALFLTLISMVWLILFLRLMNTEWIPFYWLLIANALTGTIYIKALQSFPRQISKQDIISVFPKNKIASGYISWAIMDYTWLIFPILLLGFSLLNINERLSDLFVLLTGLLCMYINYKKSSTIEKNKILWLFWGLISFTFLAIIQTILYYSSTEISLTVRLLFNVFMMFAFILSLVMSLFFSNTFDTGILIRRTIADGFIFIIIVLIYNTVEHYFLHWLSHELKISDVILTSLLSGIFVLTFSPLHHKIMNYLEKKVKNNHVEHTEI
ncbi:MAG: hypothetical protein PSX36_04520 [bacterium]|nr:hypothetical protein [bacterium]